MDLLPKLSDRIVVTTFTDTFSLTDIGDNGRYIEVSSVFRSYNILYNRIIEATVLHRAELDRYQEKFIIY
jgi:hypothetical protein